MANQVFTNIKNKLEQKLKYADVKSIKSARDTYKVYGTALMRNNVTGNELMRQQPNRLINVIRKHHLGRMVMFFYDPKLANELPYYDQFPLVIPLEIYNDGFLGINFHYLPPLHRARLLDRLLAIYDDKHLDERKRLIISYNLMYQYARSAVFIPCVKRYLYSHLKSRLFLLEPSDWEIAILLPTERFQKARKTRVYAESMIKVKR